MSDINKILLQQGYITNIQGFVGHPVSELDNSAWPQHKSSYMQINECGRVPINLINGTEISMSYNFDVS